MEHHFNTDIAKDCGIEEAILLHNFHFWLSKNAANEKHFHDGLYWFYNSKKAFVDLFPYMNETKIFRSIKNLEERGFIVKGNYNTDKWDRTNWYAITKIGLTYLQTKGYSISVFGALFQNDTIDSGKMNDGTMQSEQSILINNTYTNTDTDKKDKEESLSKSASDVELFEKCWIAYRRKGSKKKAFEYWCKLNDVERQNVLPHIKPYVASREMNYQKDFERYLRDKIFLDVVFKNNSVIYDPVRLKSVAYTPQGRSIWFDESTKSYWTDDNFYYGVISDGYTDEDRPDGATLTMSNARGIITWNANTKKWEKK